MLMSNWLILHYIYTVSWTAVCSSGTESHNSRIGYNKYGLVYFINCVQICGCWQSDVSDTVRCAWQWWQQTVLQHQWGAAGCLYCESMFWRCASLSGSEITKHAVSANNTTRHPSYINSNNPRCRTDPSTPAAVCYSQYARYVLYQLTVLCKHGHYFIWQIPSVTSTHQFAWLWTICSAGHISTVNGTKWSGKDRQLMKQYHCVHLLIFGTAAQYRYSAVKGKCVNCYEMFR